MRQPIDHTPSQRDLLNNSEIDHAFRLNNLNNTIIELNKTLPDLLDKAKIQTRKTTADFLRNFIDINKKDEKEIDSARIVNFLMVFQYILTALEKTNTIEAIAESKFIAALLNSLKILLSHSEEETFKKSYLSGKEKDGNKKLEKIKAITHKIKENLETLSPHLIPETKDLLPAERKSISENIQQLFNYCAKGEVDKNEGGGKIREKIYDILLQYFNLNYKAENHVALFLKISETLQFVSNKEIKKLLSSFRDALAEKLFITNPPSNFKFNELQASQILSHINSSNVSKHTMKIIDYIDQQFDSSQPDLRLFYLQKLILEASNVKKNMQGQYLISKGIDFPKTLTDLIHQTSLPTSTRQTAMVLGFIWNFWMVVHQAKNKADINSEHLVALNNDVMGPRHIENHPFFKSWVEKICKNTSYKFDFNETYVEICQLCHEKKPQYSQTNEISTDESSSIYARSSSFRSESLTTISNPSPPTTPVSSAPSTPRGPGFFTAPPPAPTYTPPPPPPPAATRPPLS